MIELQHKLGGWNTKDAHDAEHFFVWDSIADALDELSKEQKIYYSFEESWRDIPWWWLPFISNGFKAVTLVSAYPKTQEQYQFLLENKPFLRQNLGFKCKDLFESTIAEQLPELQLAMAPQKPFGFTFEIQCNDPTMWEWVDTTLKQALYQALRKQKPFYGYGWEEESIGPTTIHYYFSSECMTEDEWNQVKQVAGEAIQGIGIQDQYLNITFRPDLDQ